MIVALITDDFVLYHALAPYFEALGLHLHAARSTDPLPEADVLLGGPESDPRSVPIQAHPEGNFAVVAAAIMNPSVATVGVDPGETVGLALLFGSEPVRVMEARNPDDVAANIAAWHQALPIPMEVHLGDGARAYGLPLHAAIRAAAPGLPVVTVSEHNSNSRRARGRHGDAAILIARRSP